MGLEIPIAWLSVLLFGSLALLLSLGLPMAFCTGSLAVIFGGIAVGLAALGLYGVTAYSAPG